VVNEGNEDVVLVHLYPSKPKSFRWKYDVGDRVRIAMHRQPFRKAYLGQWSEEILEIAMRVATTPVTYELRDLAGEARKRSIYEPEIQTVLKSDNECFDIDGILKTRKSDGKDTIPGVVERVSE